MVEAVLTDFARIDGVQPITTWDARLGECNVEGVDVRPVSDAHNADAMFHDLAAQCDAIFVIAPETDGILARQRERVDKVGGRYLGCDAEAIEICSDKLTTCRQLELSGIATIPTELVDASQLGPPFDYPVVIKLRDGAGSQDTFLVRSRAEWNTHRNGIPGSRIVQPFVAGEALSIAVLFDSNSDARIVLPVAEQHLSSDGRFTYRGGRIAASNERLARIEHLVNSAIDAIPGLSGYVGFDVVVPHKSSNSPVIVEINPRLTTSYLGYRALCLDNLAECLLFPDRIRRPLNWKRDVVEFDTTGRVYLRENSSQRVSTANRLPSNPVNSVPN